MAIAVVWGNKQRSSLAGFAADYCVICRDVREFAIHQLTVVSHVYWIPTSSPKPVGCVAECIACATCVAVNAEAFAGFASTPGSDLNALVNSTNPSAWRQREERKQLETTARQGTESALVRMRLISEPFQLLAPLVEELYARRERRSPIANPAMEIAKTLSPIHVIESGPATGTLAPGATLCLLAAIFVPIGLLGAGIAAIDTGPIPKWSWISALVTLVFAIVGIAKFQSAHRKRVLQHCVLPLLSNSLQCLDPTLAEIRETMRIYSANGLRIGSAFQPEDIHAAVSSAP